MSLSGSVPPGSATVTTVAETAAVGKARAAMESEWRKGLKGLNWRLAASSQPSGSLGCWGCQWWAGVGRDLSPGLLLQLLLLGLLGFWP